MNYTYSMKIYRKQKFEFLSEWFKKNNLVVNPLYIFWMKYVIFAVDLLFFYHTENDISNDVPMKYTPITHTRILLCVRFVSV